MSRPWELVDEESMNKKTRRHFISGVQINRGKTSERMINCPQKEAWSGCPPSD